MFGWCCVVCFAWLLFVLSSFVCFVSAWWIRGIADEVTIASFCKAVTGTAVMARSANEEKKMPLATCSDHFLKLRYGKIARRCSEKHIFKSKS